MSAAASSSSSSSSASASTPSYKDDIKYIKTTFATKYDEFLEDLEQTFPELSESIGHAKKVSPSFRLEMYRKQVVQSHTRQTDALECPGVVLPHVTITEGLWSTASEKTKAAVYEYLAVLDMCSVYASLDFLNEKDDGEMAGKGFLENLMKNMGGKLEGINFEAISKKITELFGEVSGSEEDGAAAGAAGVFPEFSQKFLKGKLAKLAEEMLREFNPEDFGLRPEDLKEMESNPAKAVELLMKAINSEGNMDIIKKVMTRISKRLQEKVQRGELRPQELVEEAEALIKEFQENPKFVELMESFRSMMSFEDPDFARAAGREGTARMSIVRDRLRKKLEAKRQQQKK
jgi:hypothetical protein